MNREIIRIIMAFLASFYSLNAHARETRNGDLDRSGIIDAADGTILRNYLAGNLIRIPGQAGQLYQADPIAGNLRLIPAGTFYQGENPGDACHREEETPFTHTLTADLSVMQTEVTRQMWADLQAIRPELPDDPSNTSISPGPRYPVQQTTWHEAVLFANLLSLARGLTPCYYKDSGFITPVDDTNYLAGSFFCRWDADGFRLPSEGEWEYGCRSGSALPFFPVETNFVNCDVYGTAGSLPALEGFAWYLANSDCTAHPAGLKAANAGGLQDMHGNVLEWCWDWHPGKWPYYPAGPQTDYHGAANGPGRIIRGGSWNSGAPECRSARRDYGGPGGRFSYVGFRLARRVTSASTELLNGDLDRSGTIDAADEVILRNYLAGNISQLPAQAGELYQVDPTTGNLRYVPGGTFTQGYSPGDACGTPAEVPFIHTLTLNLAVMETEVTRQMWADLLSRQSSLPPDPSLPAISPALNCPAQNVSWNQAVLFANLLSLERGLTRCYYADGSFTAPVDATNYLTCFVYCNWLANGFRLPGEGEWEYLCRAGTTTPFSVAEDGSVCDSCEPGSLPGLESVAWFCADAASQAHPVGWKGANPWHLKDVHGNVLEWCWDWYDPSYHSLYPVEPQTDYRGPDWGDYRICRGGSWASLPEYCRSGSRNLSHNRSGFRLVRTVQ